MAARIGLSFKCLLPLLLLLLLLGSSVHNHWIALIPVLNVDAAASVNSPSDPAYTSSSCFAADLAALRSFAANLASSPTLLTWKGDDCCAWEGVRCTTNSSEPAAAARRVSGIALSYVYDRDREGRYFTGPEALLSLCSLSALSSLQLDVVDWFLVVGHPLTSVGGAVVSIPECVGTSLTNLETLELSGFGAALTGSIPQSFSRLRSLRVLDLSLNDLSGPFPSFLCTDLPNLTALDLAFNSFSGSIPAYDAPHLATLWLPGNSLSCNLSDFFSHSNLPNLTDLDLSSNSLSGNLSDFFSHSNLPNLTTLDLSGNSFSGSIPACDAPHLATLYLSGNSLSGDLSDFFSHSNLPNLTALYLRDNSLSGDLSDFFSHSNLPNLTALDLSSNYFSGDLSDFFSHSNLANLTALYLSSNSLSGNLSDFFSHSNLPNLTTLDLSYNRFTGPFPSWLGSLSNLSELDLSYNNFTGRLPDEWHKLSLLTALGLSGNSLMPHDHPDSPLLPLWLFQLPLTVLDLASMHLEPADLDCESQLLLLNATIKWLVLSDNNLSASVLWCLLTPHNNFSSLITLNMSGNPLSLTLNGADPIKLLLTQKSMEVLDLSSCELNGSLTHIFTEDSTMPLIRELYLANNGLVGEIPPQLGNLSDLEILDLSNNSFTRFSPFRDHKLPTNPIRRLKLSNNNLTGDVSPMLLSLYNYRSLDELGHQCDLAELDLSHNSLTGGITASLRKCLYLRRLKLNGPRKSVISRGQPRAIKFSLLLQ